MSKNFTCENICLLSYYLPKVAHFIKQFREKHEHVQPGDSLQVGDPTSQLVVNAIDLLQSSTDMVVLLTHEPDQTDEITAYTLQGFVF